MGAGAELSIDALVLARDEAETGHYSRALAVFEPVLAEFNKRGTDIWLQARHPVRARLWQALTQAGAHTEAAAAWRAASP